MGGVGVGVGELPTTASSAPPRALLIVSLDLLRPGVAARGLSESRRPWSASRPAQYSFPGERSSRELSLASRPSSLSAAGAVAPPLLPSPAVLGAPSEAPSPVPPPPPTRLLLLLSLPPPWPTLPALRATAADSQSDLGPFPATALDAERGGDGVDSSIRGRRNGEPPPPPVPSIGEPDSPAVASSVCSVFGSGSSPVGGAAAVGGVVETTLSPAATGGGEVALALALAGVCRLDEAGEEGDKLGRFFPGRECGGVASREGDNGGLGSAPAGGGD